MKRLGAKERFENMKKQRKAWISLILFALALAVCVYGAIRGEAKDVLIKATKICLECIGLG